MKQWGGKRDIIYCLTMFGSLKKRANEPIVNINKIFNKLYKKIPKDIKPSQPRTKVTYVGAFDADFDMMLR
jgi:hypothetical protein